MDLMTVDEAARSGDSVWLRKALDGAFGEFPACDLESALLRACDYGHQDCVRLLLNHGVPLDCRDNSNRCPLTLAAKHGHVGIVELLLDGAFGEIPAADLEWALLLACDCGYVDCVILLLKHGVRLDFRDNYNRCPLNLAAEHGIVGIVEFVLDGAFGEIPARDLEKALLSACEYGHMDCVKLLLKHGVSLDCRGDFNESPLTLAADHGHVGIIELLLGGAFGEITARDLESALLSACEYGHLDCVRLLLKHGVPLDCQYYNICPLNLAAKHGHVGIVELLLGGAFGEIPARGLASALLSACEYGHIDCVRLLLKDGVPLDCREYLNESPVTLAAEHGHVGIVELLLDGTFGEIPARDLESALLSASEYDHMDCVRLLLKHGVPLDCRDDFNESPFTLAADHGHVGIVELLLDGTFGEIPARDLESALLSACEYDHMDCVRLLLKHGVPLDCRDDFNESPFTIAADHGHVGIVELLLDGAFGEIPAADLGSGLLCACVHRHLDCVGLLLKHGVPLDCLEDFNKSPLTLAADHGHVGIIELLLDGAFGEIPAADLWSALLRACEFGHMDCVRLLLKHGVPIDCWYNFNKSPLTIAADHGHVGIVELLLDGAIGEIPAADLGSGLLCACVHRHLDCVRLLLKHGVPLDCLDDFNESPLTLAADHGHVGIIELLLDGAFGEIPAADLLWALLRVCEYGHLDCVRLLLKHGVPLDCRDNCNRCPLSLAADHGHVGIIALLLDGAFGEIPASDRESALLRASECGHMDCVKLLLKHGVPLDCRDDFNKSPFTLAADHGHVGIVELLLDGTFGEIPARDLESALLSACEYDHMDCVRLLLKHGVPIDCRYYFYKSPLTIAANHGHVGIVELLLDGANGEIPAADLGSALLCACIHRHLDCVRLLLKHGVPLDCLDDFIESPLTLAADHGHVGIIELLLDGAFGEIAAADLSWALLRACEYGHLDCVRLLLKHGVPLDCRDNCTSRCPLSLAADHGHVGIIALLLDGAFGEIPASDRESALLRASKCGHMDCVKLLLKNCVPLDCRNNFNSSPLHCAAVEGHVDIVKVLLEAGADVNSMNDSGHSPILEAMAGDNFDVVRILLNHHAILCTEQLTRKLEYRPHRTDHNNRVDSALEYAVKADNVELVRTLLAADACVFDLEDGKRTALHTAMYCTTTQIVQMLLDAGADIDHLDCDGKSPLFIAIARHNHLAIKALICGNCRLDIRYRDLYTGTVMSVFYWAMWEKDVETMEMLYQAGACTNAVLSECVNSEALRVKCSDAPAVYERLKHYMSQVNSLANMCRLAIRSRMRPPENHTVMSLSLPMSLKSYILFND